MSNIPKSQGLVSRLAGALVRTTALVFMGGLLVAAFQALPSAEKSLASAPAANAVSDKAGAIEALTAQAQKSGPRVVYAGPPVTSERAPQLAVASRGGETASPALPPSGSAQAPAEGVPVVSPPPQPAPPSVPAAMGKPTTSDPTAAIQVASASERADLPSAPASPRVDLNTATLEELNKLNGAGLIGRAIMRGRPYTTPEDLVKKQVINRATYERIKDQIAAR